MEKLERTLEYKSGKIKLLYIDKEYPDFKHFKIECDDDYPRNMTIRAVTGWKYYEPGFDLCWEDSYISFNYGDEYRYDVDIHFNKEIYTFKNCIFGMVTYDNDRHIYDYYQRYYLCICYEDFSINEHEIMRFIKDLYDYQNKNDDGQFNEPIIIHMIESDINIEIRKKKKEEKERKLQIIIEKEKELESRYVSSLLINSGNIDLYRKSKKQIKGARLYNDNTYIEVLLERIDNDPEKDLIFTIKSPDIKLDKNKKYTVAFKYKNRRRDTGSIYVKASSSFKVISDYENPDNQVLYVNIEGIRKRRRNIKRIINRVKYLNKDAGTKNLHFDSPFELRIYESK